MGAHTRRHGGRSDRGRALDVVVERANAVLVLVQEAEGIGVGEVLVRATHLGQVRIGQAARIH